MSDAVVAVTGANGYVGSLIVSALKSEARVICLVRVPRSAEEIAWSFDVDPMALEAALRQHRVTHLIHAAWDMKANSLTAMERTCVAGSSTLFAAASAAGLDRLIFIST